MNNSIVIYADWVYINTENGTITWFESHKGAIDYMWQQKRGGVYNVKTFPRDALVELINNAKIKMGL